RVVNRYDRNTLVIRTSERSLQLETFNRRNAGRHGIVVEGFVVAVALGVRHGVYTGQLDNIEVTLSLHRDETPVELLIVEVCVDEGLDRFFPSVGGFRNVSEGSTMPQVVGADRPFVEPTIQRRHRNRPKLDVAHLKGI